MTGENRYRNVGSIKEAEKLLAKDEDGEYLLATYSCAIPHLYFKAQQLHTIKIQGRTGFTLELEEIIEVTTNNIMHLKF